MDAMKYMNDIVVFFWYSVLVVLAAAGILEFIKKIFGWIGTRIGRMIGERLMNHDTDDDTQN